MGAAELLRDLAGAGFALDVADGRLLVSPASRLTDRLRSELRAYKPQLVEQLTHQTHHTHHVDGRRCADCRHQTRRKTCLQPELAGLIPAAEGFGIAWPGPVHAATCPAWAAKRAAA